jgi:hypothetical protein
MDVPLPDGSIVHIQYHGDVAPKVTVGPGAVGEMGGMWAPMGMPIPQVIAIPDVSRIMAQMDEEMARMQQHSARAPGMNIASFGNMPAGASSVSVYTVSNGGRTCTQTTEVVSQGEGKSPKVTTRTSGECGPETATVSPAVPRATEVPTAPKGPINRT